MCSPRAEIGEYSASALRTVLVLGATGRIGLAVADRLSVLPSVKVVRAARSVPANRHGAGDDFARVDITDQRSLRDALARYRPDLVILCVEPTNAEVHRACFEVGATVVDVCATPSQLDRVEALNEVAHRHGAAAILSVGLAPGLTNYLAHRASLLAGGASRIDLTVLLGAAEAHGADAVRWTLDALAAEEFHRVAARKVEIPGFGRRTTYAMPFSDQQTLRRTGPFGTVITRMCLDSRLVSAVLFGVASHSWSRHLFRNGLVRRAVMRSSGRIRLGGDSFVVMAEASGEGTQAACWLAGAGQSATTALVAALVAEAALEERPAPGVWHLEQLPDVLARLERVGDNEGYTVGSARRRFGHPDRQPVKNKPRNDLSLEPREHAP